MKDNPSHKSSGQSRRDFLRRTARTASALALGGLAGVSLAQTRQKEWRWQLDPYKCVQCGRCQTHCVLALSAVRCMHAYAMCGYCKLCSGYHKPNATALDTSAENQLCPTGAIIRTYVEDPYYEYTIDREKCVGCGKCVAGCYAFGNGSLFLQVQHDICVDCNECSIARNCPAEAFARVPASSPYILKQAASEEAQS